MIGVTMEPSADTSAAPAPLVPVALLLMGGIVAGRYVPAPASLWLLGAVAAWMTALVLARHAGGAGRLALAAAIALAGAGAAAAAWHRIPPGHLAGFCPQGRSALATVTGRVLTVPRCESFNPPTPFEAYPRPPVTRYLLAAETVSTRSGPRPCRGRVAVGIDGDATDVAPGERVRIAGRLSLVVGANNPGQWDRRDHARRDGVIVRLSAPAREAVTVLSPPPGGPAALLWRLRAIAGRRLGAGAEPHGRMILGALVLGHRPARLRGLQQSMIRSGVAHFLSISGMHLGILLGLAYGLLRLGRTSPRWAAGIVLVLLAGYLLIAEPRTPVLRGSIMAGGFCLAVMLGRPANGLNLLAAAAIALLVADPIELFRPGFQLSFGVVTGIYLLLGAIRRLLFGRPLGRAGLMVFGPDERLRRAWWRVGLPFTANLVSVSVAAWLAGAPLVAYHFGVFTPLAPLATLVLLPIVTVTLVGGYVQMIGSLWLPNLTASLGGLMDALTGLLAVTADRLGRLGPCIELLPVPPWTAAVTAGAIVAAAHHRRLALTRAWAAVVLLGVLTVVAAATQTDARPREATLTVLDVRDGLCTVLRTSSGRTYLFDAGSRSLTDPYKGVLRPCLRARRWPPPTAAFVSHAEIDHYNALPALMNDVGLPVLVTHGRFGDGAGPSEPVSRLLDRIRTDGTRHRRLGRGGRIRLDARTTVTCLWPPEAAGFDPLSANDASLVLRVDCDGVRFLLPGDIQHLGQQLLLDLDPSALAADVLVLPHHGSATPALEAFVDAVDPSVVIRSAGPRRDGAVRELETLAVNRRFLATSHDGAVTVTMVHGRPLVRAFALDGE
ncbi:MAG: ComEC/Rec2 family competence protein [Planctomycetota bacterium]